MALDEVTRFAEVTASEAADNFLKTNQEVLEMLEKQELEDYIGELPESEQLPAE